MKKISSQIVIFALLCLALSGCLLQKKEKKPQLTSRSDFKTNDFIRFTKNEVSEKSEIIGIILKKLHALTQSKSAEDEIMIRYPSLLFLFKDKNFLSYKKILNGATALPQIKVHFYENKKFELVGQYHYRGVIDPQIYHQEIGIRIEGTWEDLQDRITPTNYSFSLCELSHPTKYYEIIKVKGHDLYEINFTNFLQFVQATLIDTKSSDVLTFFNNTLSKYPLKLVYQQNMWKLDLSFIKEESDHYEKINEGPNFNKIKATLDPSYKFPYLIMANQYGPILYISETHILPITTSPTYRYYKIDKFGGKEEFVHQGLTVPSFYKIIDQMPEEIDYIYPSHYYSDDSNNYPRDLATIPPENYPVSITKKQIYTVIDNENKKTIDYYLSSMSLL